MKMSIFCEVSEIMYLIVKMSTSLTPSLLYDICNFKNFIFIFKLFAVSFQCDFLTLAHNSQRIIFDEQFPSGFFFISAGVGMLVVVMQISKFTRIKRSSGMHSVTSATATDK